MFLHQLSPIEAEAFLNLASEMIENDGVVLPEEDALLEEYKEAMNQQSFLYDAAASAAARDTLAQLNESGKRKVYMEMFNFAVCDQYVDPSERRSLNELREALGLDEHIAKKLEDCVSDLYAVYAEIENALVADPSPVVVD